MYHGDLRLGDTIDVKFTTRRFTTGAPFTLAGVPVISAYPGNSTTQITAGITLTVDFDAVTGLHNVRVVATTANGYATATNYALVITTGTVDSVSVVGEVIGTFSIENRVINRAKFDPDTGLQSIRSSTAQAGAATTITLDTGANATDDFYNGTVILTTGGTGAGQQRNILDYVGSTKVATVDAAWVTNPDSTTTFAIFPAAETAADIADAVWNEATAGHTTAGTTGKALTDASSAGDPWATAVPGAYGAGTAGSRIGRIPDVAAGAANGLFIAGTNAPTAITTALTTTFTGNLTGSVGSVASGGITAASLAADAITAAKVAADVTTEIQSGLATAANLATVDTVVDAIKAKTDSLTFTVAGRVDANVKAVTDVALQGVGTVGNKWRPV